MNPEPIRKSKWGKVGKVGLLSVVLVISLYAVAAKVTGISEAASKYDKNRAAAKVAGLWFTDEEVARAFNISEGDNGMPMLNELLAVVYKLSHGIEPEEFNKNLHEKWTKVEPFMPVLRQAIAKPVMRGKLNVKQPHDLDKDFWILAHLVRIMVNETELKIHNGDIAQAQELLLCTASLVRHFRDRPGYPGSWISLADEVETLIKDIIPQVGGDQKWLAILSQTLDNLGSTPDLHEGLKYEHWRSLSDAEIFLGQAGSLQDLGLKKEDSTPLEYTLGKLFPLYAKANLSRLHETYAKVSRDLPLDPTQFIEVARAKKQPLLGDPLDQSYRIVNIVEPGQSWNNRDFLAECAQRNALRQALMILATDADPQKGLPLRSPSDLDVDGAKLRMVKDRGGWIIYSVGPNPRDNHAVPPPNQIDEFIVHLSPKSIHPNESIREKRAHIGSRSLD